MSQRDYERYEVQDALHTIARAEEHRGDKELMKHVRKLAASQAAAVAGGSQPKSTPPKPALAKKAAPDRAASASSRNPMMKGR